MTKITAYMTAALLLMLSACGGIEPEDSELACPPPPAADDPAFQPSPYCGDGICDEDRGEDPWWCVDCGYSPIIGGPRDGGYCGDGVCFGGETMLTCFRDCRPKPYKGQPPWDPGWIDPPPWGDEPGPPLPPGPPPPVKHKLPFEGKIGSPSGPGRR